MENERSCICVWGGIDVGHTSVCEGYRCWSYICVWGDRCWSYICVWGVSMLVKPLCVRGIDVGHTSVCEGNRCWSCLCVWGVSMLVIHLCVRGIDVGHTSVCEGYRFCLFQWFFDWSWNCSDGVVLFVFHFIPSSFDLSLSGYLRTWKHFIYCLSLWKHKRLESFLCFVFNVLFWCGGIDVGHVFVC
jgi:hypothetical protein